MKYKIIIGILSFLVIYLMVDNLFLKNDIEVLEFENNELKQSYLKKQKKLKKHVEK